MFLFTSTNNTVDGRAAAWCLLKGSIHPTQKPRRQEASRHFWCRQHAVAPQQRSHILGRRSENITRIRIRFVKISSDWPDSILVRLFCCNGLELALAVSWVTTKEGKYQSYLQNVHMWHIDEKTPKQNSCKWVSKRFRTVNISHKVCATSKPQQIKTKISGFLDLDF